MILGIPARRLAASTEATWLASRTNSRGILSDSNRVLTASSATSGRYANSVSNREVGDLCYFSGRVESTTSETAAFGLAFVSFPTSGGFPDSDSATWVGSTGSSVGLWVSSNAVYYSGINRGNLGAGTASDVQIAVRRVSSSEARVWVRVNGGAWFRGGDPTANTTPSETITGGNRLVVGGSVFTTSATSSRFVRIHPNAASTTGTVPTGFTAALWGAELT